MFQCCRKNSTESTVDSHRFVEPSGFVHTPLPENKNAPRGGTIFLAERVRCARYIHLLRPAGSYAAQIGCPADLSNRAGWSRHRLWLFLRRPARMIRALRCAHPERWQSGRMRRIRNPVYGYAVTWVRIPPSPPSTCLIGDRDSIGIANRALVARFCVSGSELVRRHIPTIARFRAEVSGPEFPQFGPRR
jgi:hypothetical protein